MRIAAVHKRRLPQRPGYIVAGVWSPGAPLAGCLMSQTVRRELVRA